MRKASRLPNMQNLGVDLRILLIVNGLLATAALALSSDMHEFLFLLTGISAVAQPMLMLSLLLLYLGYPLLTKLSYWQGISAMLLTVLVACGSLHHVFAQLQIFDSLPGLMRTLFFVAITTGITLYYFNLHHRAYSPAVAEARLQALQARIRPHFLFNSINAVLSLIRSQPKQAETALEDMADLFRVLMADNRELVPLAQEIGLCRQYLALEKLRLEDRLKIEWQIDDMPPDALIPPLVLQPLLENAVYHGIEPLPEGGSITIRIYTKGKDVHVILSNPYAVLSNHHSGNKMALKNIKERLTLHFDLEANLKTRKVNGQYQVHIVLPYSHA
jgi:two-component system sensor histidine kinase AlgZ